MKHLIKPLCVALSLSLVSLQSWAASITAVRSWRAPDNTRLVLDLSEKTTYRQLNSPAQQIIIELDNTDAAVSSLNLPNRIGLIENVLLERDGTKQRLIINLNGEVRPQLFMLSANEKNSPRLVLDLYDKVVMQSTTSPADIEDERDNGEGRAVIVAIDAGHGGEDSGAIGATGHYEKHVTLAIAKKLAALLRKQTGFKAFLTRDSDYFIPLQDRRKIAKNKYKADIFISIHADAALSPLAKGASVFALSRKGANSATSRFAQALADRENKSDLIGGVDNNFVKDSQLNNILADMVVEGSMTHSLHMGSSILKEMGDLTKLHSKQVEQAGFAVLKEAGMISLLVETGFMTNAQEEEKLISTDYQQQMAEAIFVGVNRFVKKYPISNTMFANRKEKTQRAAKKQALAELGAPLPNNTPAIEKVLDKPALRLKPDSPLPHTNTISQSDKTALLAAFSQQPTATKAQPSPTNPNKSNTAPKLAVKATLPTSLDDFMAQTNAHNSPTPKENKPIKETTDTKKPIETVKKADKKDEIKTEKAPKKTETVDKAKASVPKTHKVKVGDNLSSIAQKYGLSMQALRNANKLKDDNVLLDSTLKIPSP